MKLNLESVNKGGWSASYVLPQFDIEAMRKRTEAAPAWLHMGAGNLFRIFIGDLQQDLLEAGLADTGIIVWEGHDDEIISAAFKPYDNLTLGVTL
ncbi:MAG: mannitol dehydrogenase family protein, partial [Clostridiales bacterium]|nr:mannitol dehydrogenase family protein [Clostridiales bacterium]